MGAYVCLATCRAKLASWECAISEISITKCKERPEVFVSLSLVLFVTSDLGPKPVPTVLLPEDQPVFRTQCGRQAVSIVIILKPVGDFLPVQLGFEVVEISPLLQLNDDSYARRRYSLILRRGFNGCPVDGIRLRMTVSRQ
jgi:hypothetical protein